MEDYTVGGNFTTNETIAIASRKIFDLSHVWYVIKDWTTSEYLIIFHE